MTPAARRLVDREDIRNCIALYARGVDRGVWEWVEEAYHPDAFDDHAGAYRGGVQGLLEWLAASFSGVGDSVHHLGQTLIEFASEDTALVETHFTSVRLGAEESTVRQSWGRYIDEFARREGSWRIAHRLVIVDVALTTPSVSRLESVGSMRGCRNGDDLLHARRRDLGIA